MLMAGTSSEPVDLSKGRAMQRGERLAGLDARRHRLLTDLHASWCLS